MWISFSLPRSTHSRKEDGEVQDDRKGVFGSEATRVRTVWGVQGRWVYLGKPHLLTNFWEK